jgi:hypothetical protein
VIAGKRDFSNAAGYPVVQIWEAWRAASCGLPNEACEFVLPLGREMAGNSALTRAEDVHPQWTARLEGSEEIGPRVQGYQNHRRLHREHKNALTVVPYAVPALTVVTTDTGVATWAMAARKLAPGMVRSRPGYSPGRGVLCRLWRAASTASEVVSQVPFT